jgi:hypothetical protein
VISLRELQELADAKASLTLYHGTDFVSATDIENNGLNRATAQNAGGEGDFWATNDTLEADVFAQVNPANGQPVRLEFELAASVLVELIARDPAQAQIYHRDGIRFFATSFAILNRHMKCKRIQNLP